MQQRSLFYKLLSQAEYCEGLSEGRIKDEKTLSDLSVLVVAKMKTKENIYALLHEIPDPEIPVISIVELGVIRNVVLDNKNIEVTITPTYSGCPAMKQMEDDVRKKLLDNGFENVKINTVFNPPWTTDWLNKEARQKLQNYGIAPPEENTTDKSFLTNKPKNITCPRCKSKNTTMVSQFGSTACKALYKCSDCLEAFDYFKCI